MADSAFQDRLAAAARALASRLAQARRRVVFAESCTAGLVSASLAAIPGISEWHCGAAVTYRERTKQDWLGVSAIDLAQFTAVSEPIARQMALGVLERTIEADCSASVTGHLGPNAPAGFDGLIFIGVARRTEAGEIVVEVERRQLAASGRLARQREAAALVLERVISAT